MTTPDPAAIVEPAAPEAAAAATTPQIQQPDPTPKPNRRSLEDTLSGLDDDAKQFVLEQVNKARNEAKNLRDRAKAADDGKTDLVSKVAKALGIESTEPDPVDLARQLSESTTAAQEARKELAVYQAAGEANAIPTRLLDSRSFMKSLEGVDPADTATVTAKIAAAVAADPTLAAAPVRRLPAPNPAQGAVGAPPTAAEVKAAAERDGDWKTVDHMNAEQLITQLNSNR